MKTLINMTLTILIVVAGLFGIRYQLESSQGLTGDKGIKFYNWGDYIDPDLLKRFEEETGYSVIYETFDSNEAMFTKVKQGGTQYDILVPSEYMIESLIDASLLQPIDYAQLPNFQYLDERFIDQPFDPENEYSIPYFWGTLGILYDTKYIDASQVETWDDLWNPEFAGSIMIYDGAREVLGIGLQSLGYSLNETDDAKLIEAAAKMKTLMPNIIALVADEMKMHINQEEAPIGITFSGEAATAMYDNEDLAYHVPDEGSNLWFDNLVIPANSRNPEGAHALINFLLDPEIAAINAEYVGYATPNAAALELMDPEITSDEAFYPSDEVIERLEVYRDLGQEKLIQYNDLYLQVKIEPR